MQKRSAMIIAGALVAALMAGFVSRDLTLPKPPPAKIVVVQAAPSAMTPQTTTPQTTTPQTTTPQTQMERD
jgi:hypothetical protein